MSLADELLNSINETEAPIESLAEGHIVVDISRKVSVPDALKRIGVQYDHNIETVTFDCPRYWDNHDMSEMGIYINYMREDKKSGSYIATNIRVDENDESIMHFDWTVSRNVTEVAGKVSFVVCIKEVNDNGQETIHWNSEMCTETYVSAGIECAKTTYRQYPDIIEHLRARISSNDKLSDDILKRFETLIVQNLGSEEDVTVSQKIITEELNSKANAVKGTTTGETIFLDDIAPSDHLVRLRMLWEGFVEPETDVVIRSSINNLIPYPYSDRVTEKNGVTVTDNGDGSITFNGISTEELLIRLVVNPSLKSGYYTLSGGEPDVSIVARKNNASWLESSEAYETGFLEDGETVDYIGVYISGGKTLNNVTVYPRFTPGDTLNEEGVYDGEIITTTANAEVYLKSTSPTMVISSDIDGLVLEVEYVRNLDKALKSKADIIEKDGTIYLKVGETEVQEHQLKAVMPEPFFTVEGIKFEFVFGMTWSDFINSEYNIYGPLGDERFFKFNEYGNVEFCDPDGMYYTEIADPDTYEAILDDAFVQNKKYIYL